MTNLTEQWKKGELPSGWYYVKGNRAEGIYAYTAEYLNNMYRPRNDEKIIEQVPTFDEYQKLLSDQLAKNEGVEINAELEAENIKLKTENKWYSEQLNEAVKENTKLKELLKECEHMIIAYSINNNTFTKEEIKNIISKIDQVLGDSRR